MSVTKFAFLPPNSAGAILCTHLKSPLYWEQLNQTKDNKSNNTRKLGWVPYIFSLKKIRTCMEQTKSDDLGI